MRSDIRLNHHSTEYKLLYTKSTHEEGVRGKYIKQKTEKVACLLLFTRKQFTRNFVGALLSSWRPKLLPPNPTCRLGFESQPGLCTNRRKYLY